MCVEGLSGVIFNSKQNGVKGYIYMRLCKYRFLSPSLPPFPSPSSPSWRRSCPNLQHVSFSYVATA